MSHQPMLQWNAETKSVDKISFNIVEPKQTWDVGHYTGYREPSAGEITLREHDFGALGGAYLECSINGEPFFSIMSDVDQWGTWYNFKLSSDKDEVTTQFTYAFEWGRPSFIRALAASLIEFADMSEPREEQDGNVSQEAS